MLRADLCFRSKRNPNSRSSASSSSRDKDYLDALISIRRCDDGGRSRDNCYPSLLTGTEKPNDDDDDADKTEMMYRFGRTEYLAATGAGGYCPAGYADCYYAGASQGTGGGGGSEAAPCRDAGSGGGAGFTRLPVENGRGGVTYARFRLCPHCVRRRCRCESGWKRPSGGEEESGEEIAPPGGDPDLDLAVVVVRPSSANDPSRAHLVSMLQWDDEEEAEGKDRASSRRILDPDLPDLHPMMSRRLASPNREDRDDDVVEEDVAKQRRCHRRPLTSSSPGADPRNPSAIPPASSNYAILNNT